MKRLVLVVALVFGFSIVIAPALYAEPVWWNPLSWFESEEEQNPVWFNPLSWTRTKGESAGNKSQSEEKKIHKESTPAKIETKEESPAVPAKIEAKEESPATQGTVK